MISNRNGAALRHIAVSAAVFVLLLCAVFLAGCQQKAIDPIGIWRGTIKNNSGEQVVFTLEVKREGDKIVGALLNGDERTVSTGGSLKMAN